MKRYLALALAFFITYNAQAADPKSLLAVDFNAGEGSPSTTQAGFEEFNIGVGEMMAPLTQSYRTTASGYSGTLVVTLGRGDAGEREPMLTGRVSKELEDVDLEGRDLLKDSVRPAAGNKQSYLIVRLEGLKKEQKYEIRLYAYLPNQEGSLKFVEWTMGAEGESAALNWFGNEHLSTANMPNSLSEVLTIRSDSQGMAEVRVLGDTTAPLLCGFTVLEAK